MKNILFGIVLWFSLVSTGLSSSFAGYFFKACNDSISSLKLPSPYLLEIEHLTADSLSQSALCAYLFKDELPTNDWKISLVPFKTLNYFYDNKNNYQVIAQIANTTLSDNQGYSSYLIVRKDSNIYSLADLSNSEILTSAKSSLSTSVYPQYVMGEFFKKNKITIVNSPSYNRELDDLDSNKAKAAFVNNYILSLGELKSYRVIMQFNWLPDYLVVVNNNALSKQQVSKIKQKFLLQNARIGYSFYKPNLKLIDSYQHIANENN